MRKTSATSTFELWEERERQRELARWPTPKKKTNKNPIRSPLELEEPIDALGSVKQKRCVILIYNLNI